MAPRTGDPSPCRRPCVAGCVMTSPAMSHVSTTTIAGRSAISCSTGQIGTLAPGIRQPDFAGAMSTVYGSSVASTPRGPSGPRPSTARRTPRRYVPVSAADISRFRNAACSGLAALLEGAQGDRRRQGWQRARCGSALGRRHRHRQRPAPCGQPSAGCHRMSEPAGRAAHDQVRAGRTRASPRAETDSCSGHAGSCR